VLPEKLLVLQQVLAERQPVGGEFLQLVARERGTLVAVSQLFFFDAADVDGFAFPCGAMNFRTRAGTFFVEVTRTCSAEDTARRDRSVIGSEAHNFPGTSQPIP